MRETMIWACFCLLALGAAVRRPTLTRRFLGGFFLVMALGVNVLYVLLDPAGFVRIGTDGPLLGIYSWTFSHLVAISPVAFGLALAAFEVAAGILMICGGRAGRWGLVGGIGFLVLSTPLGIWTLPNLILACALLAILRRDPDLRPSSSAVSPTWPTLSRVARSA